MAEAGVALRELEARPVTDLTGVGERIARSLHGVGVTSVLDLISYYPRRYLDRTRLKKPRLGGPAGAARWSKSG